MKVLFLEIWHSMKYESNVKKISIQFCLGDSTETLSVYIFIKDMKSTQHFESQKKNFSCKQSNGIQLIFL